MPEVVLHAGYAGLEDSECLLENTGREPAEFILAAGVSNALI